MKFCNINISNLSLSILWLVNVLFIFKYGLRISVFFSSSIVLFYTIIIWLIFRHQSFLSKINLLYVLAAVSVIAFIPTLFIPVESLNVDRYKIISLFVSSVENGLYPYSQFTDEGNPPGPSPVYFLLAYPFYKFGLFQGMALLVPWLWYFFVPFKDKERKNISTILILTSCIWYYEVVTRSTILFNSVLVCIWAIHFAKFSKWNIKALVFNGILAGLLLNTRTVFIIPMLISGLCVLIYYPRNDKIKILIWGAVLTVTFIFPFLLMGSIWDFESIIQNNPFTVQSEMILPSSLMALFIIATVIAACFTRKLINAVWVSGFMLFIVVSVNIARCIYILGFYDAVIESHVDITYLLFSIPFLIYFIKPCTRIK